MVFPDGGKSTTEFAGRIVRSIAPDGDGCIAVVDGNEIWRRSAGGQWSLVATTELGLESITSIDGKILASTGDVGLVFIGAEGALQPLTGFEAVEGRSQWFGQGPPLHIRALTATSGGGAIMAAVHVGGIPRSTDGGKTWAPTVPIDFDVHEVRAHPTVPNIVAAATAVGLCLSEDGGESWKVLAEGPEDPHSLALAILHDEILFSVQDGPFAERSQVWHWRVGEKGIKQVQDGLPHWLSGKVDTAHMAADYDRAAVVDGGGNLYLSEKGSCGWQRIATGVPYVFGMLVVPSPSS
jgi:hypothetical protein